MGREPYSYRRTVKECFSINIKQLKRDDCFSRIFTSGELSWSNNFGKELASVGYQILLGVRNYIRLQYAFRIGTTGESGELDYEIRLVSTPCNFGGKRWWFTCPFCNRRVGILYLGGTYFGCRHCYNLTYISCQQSHKFDNLLLKDAKLREKIETINYKIQRLLK